MEARKFAIGDRVRLLLDNYADDSPSDVYTISRVLPAAGNIWDYRVKRVGDGQERAVNELQLAKAGLQQLTAQSDAQAQPDTQRPRAARAAPRTRTQSSV